MPILSTPRCQKILPLPLPLRADERRYFIDGLPADAYATARQLIQRR
jgi:hypothetical protein